MNSLRLLEALPEQYKKQFEDGTLLVKMISVNAEDMDTHIQRALKDGWTPIKSFAEDGKAWAVLVTPATTQNGDG